MDTDAPGLDALDDDVRRRSFEAMTDDIKLLDDIILHLNHGASMYSGMESDRGLNLLSAVLISRAFNSLWRAREDAVAGYAVQGLALCRTALEDWGTIMWVELHPEDVDKWLWALLAEVERPASPPPKFDTIWKSLEDDGKIPADAYDALSKFGHPKSTGLRWLLAMDPEFTHIHFGPNFDAHGLRICLFFLVQVAQAFFERVARLQERTAGKPDESWLAEGLRLTDLASRFIASVADDIAATRGGASQVASL